MKNLFPLLICFLFVLKYQGRQSTGGKYDLTGKNNYKKNTDIIIQLITLRVKWYKSFLLRRRTYTPVYSSVSNIDAVEIQAIAIIEGSRKTVNVWGTVSINPTNDTVTEFKMTLPISSTLGSVL